MELIINDRDSGQKLLKLLMRKTNGSKVFLYKLFRKNKVKVNGKPSDHNYLTKSGDCIILPGVNEKNQNHKFQDVDPDIEVIYLDDNLAAVDKDENTAVHFAAGINYKETLVEKLKAYLYIKNQPYDFTIPVHRIDRNTRGIVIFARNYKTVKTFSQYMKEGKITKIYRALLKGKLSDSLFVEADIIRSDNVNGTNNKVLVKNIIVSGDIPDKKEWIISRYNTSKTISATLIKPVSYTNGCTEAEIIIWTGRHHQIRAVCEAIGLPIAGDNKYFGVKGISNSREHISPLLKNQALICKKMVIEEMNLTIESKQSLNNYIYYL